jgi:hypothetical protein
MRAMQEPWGKALAVTGAILVLLLLLALLAVLTGLTLFLVRRSRWKGPVSM